MIMSVQRTSTAILLQANLHEGGLEGSVHRDASAGYPSPSVNVPPVTASVPLDDIYMHSAADPLVAQDTPRLPAETKA